MANWWQIQRLKQGVKGWNKWREKHPGMRPDLIGANLSSFGLMRGDPSGNILIPFNRDIANLSHVDLSSADLIGANLRDTNLCGADLHGARLNEANLRYANLGDADLSGANLSGADLHGADLRGVYLNESIFSRTTCIDLDFRTAYGLASIEHRGPSPIHLASVQLPPNAGALHFLRGVGLADEQIDAWRVTTMLPIQYYSVFISYSSEDKNLASRLHTDLQDHGVRCWFAPEDMKIGNKIRDRLDQAIQMQDRSLLLLSEHSIASTWVEQEVEAVLEKENLQQREILFPVRLDDAIMHTSQAWAATLRRSRHIGDFTDWTDPQKYQTVFERLLRDLKAD